MMRPAVPLTPSRHRATLAAIAVCLGAPALATAATPAPGDRPMGRVFDWSHELNQEELPNWDPKKPPPIPEARWYRIIDGILETAGRSGLWFSGFSALPHDIALHPKEPKAWRNPANFMRQYRRTGLSWDLNVEAWAAKNALCFLPRIPKGCTRTAAVSNPRAKAPQRRASLIDPAYRQAALAEIRRLVPQYADKPYVFSYTGSDEPFAALPRGKALSSPFARALARDIRRDYGWELPRPTGKPSADGKDELRWLAYSRLVSDRFFDMKKEQAELIRRLDRDARITPNDYGFIDGFLPWDYTRLAEFADIVEADPYVSYPERDTPGRGRYNGGFTAKLLSDLTGKQVRIIVQAFTYAGYTPTVRDLESWSAQALRAGATHLAFYANGNPRFTKPTFYAGMLSIARRLRGTRLPAPPTDRSQVIVYSTASEGQAQPERNGDARYRTRSPGLYTTYALLGELARGSFVFDADTRIAREPARLAGVRTVWLPRGKTLDRPFAERLQAWVQGGGTLVVTDPEAFTRAPDGSSLAPVREALIGARLGRVKTGSILLADPNAFGAGLPVDTLTLPIDSEGPRRAFASLPTGARVVARFLDDAPAAIVRTVGRGRVIAFSSDLMAPQALDQPLDLVTLVAAIHRSGGGTLGHPAWRYQVPGGPRRPPAPWKGSYDP
jgi:hypothetical protein